MATHFHFRFRAGTLLPFLWKLSLFSFLLWNWVPAKGSYPNASEYGIQNDGICSADLKDTTTESKPEVNHKANKAIAISEHIRFWKEVMVWPAALGSALGFLLVMSSHFRKPRDVSGWLVFLGGCDIVRK